MKLIYEDDYGNQLRLPDAVHIPRMGESVLVDGEYYKVTDVTWDVSGDSVTVSYKENVVRSVDIAENDTGRLNRVNNAIVALNKRQDASEKKTRALTEQVGSVRKHINQRIQAEKKESQ